LNSEVGQWLNATDWAGQGRKVCRGAIGRSRACPKPAW
jgi:hypothetical protein